MKRRAFLELTGATVAQQMMARTGRAQSSTVPCQTGLPPSKVRLAGMSLSELRQQLYHQPLRLSPGVRQTVKTLHAVRWNLIVPRTGFPARCEPAGEAEAGSAGVQPAKE